MQTVFVCVLSWLTDALLFRIEPTPRKLRSGPARALSMVHVGQSQAMLLYSSVIKRSNGTQQFDAYRATGVHPLNFKTWSYF
jgi:hypothetical protein